MNDVAEKPPFGEVLEKAVADFEAQFKIVDDHYMHHGRDTTIEGTLFVPIRTDATQDHHAAIEEWVRLATAAVADGPRAYLAWRERPHFEAVVDGFVLRSRFAIQAAIGDITRARLDALPPATKSKPNFGDLSDRRNLVVNPGENVVELDGAEPEPTTPPTSA